MFDFGAARQHAGLLAGNDMVLQLDASDEVPVFDRVSLDDCCRAPETALLDYVIHLGTVRFRTSRFYDRRAYEWRGRVHEALYPASLVPPVRPARKLLCAQRMLSVRHHRDQHKTRNYLPGLALDVLTRPAEPRWRHYLGRELYYQQWYHSALAVLEAHAATTGAWDAERAQSLCFAGECFERLGEREHAVSAYHRAAAIDATRREPRLRLASLCCRRGDFAACVEHAQQALAIPWTSPYPELEANYTWLPHALLYWSLFWLGRRTDARAHWEICRDSVPGDPVIASHGRFFQAVAERQPPPDADAAAALSC
jgi:tetratricopeptide (TPR) repeat protein